MKIRPKLWGKYVPDLEQTHKSINSNLDSILKSRDITLPTKVRLVMYGCESWTVRKAERRRIDAFEL